MWLARLLFQHLSTADLKLSLHDSGRFMLQSPGKTPLFQLILARHHSWELLNQLGPESYGFRVQQPAYTFNRVFFSDNGSTLVVENWCRLNDGTVHNLTALEKQRYGSRYLVNNSFFTPAPVPPEERIHEKEEKVLEKSC